MSARTGDDPILGLDVKSTKLELPVTPSMEGLSLISLRPINGRLPGAVVGDMLNKQKKERKHY